jgi:ABC-type multidrug transport system fused ATPase/permease subunit
LETSIRRIEVSRRKIGELGSLVGSAREPMLISVIAAVILVQIYYFQGTLGPILISLLFFYRALTALTMMQNSWNKFLEVSGSMENLKEFQEDLGSHQEEDGKLVFEGYGQTIQLQGVSFGYGEKLILKDIHLEILKNQSIALVGESGSGKTTLVNLIAGLLPVGSGHLMIDGVTLSDLKKESYQQRIGYITQEPVVFNDSIYNNVTFWASPNSHNTARFWKAIQQASLYDYLMELPDKEDTALGNNGINLSGGQKQRISIARELFKEVEILILDEATSALDSETEKDIHECLDQLKGKYTLITIAHRLTTIKNADQIIVLEKGEMISMGTFEELIESSEKFKNSVALQNL